MLYAQVKLSGLLSVAGDARRMYVDVHVMRVCKKIAERETKNKTMESAKGVSPQVEPVTHSETAASSFSDEFQTTRTDSASVQYTVEHSLDASSQSQSSSSFPPSQTVSEPERPTQTEAEPEPEPEPETPLQPPVPIEEVPAALEEAEVDDFLKQLGLDESVVADPSPDPNPDPDSDSEPNTDSAPPQDQDPDPEQDPALLHAKVLQETAQARRHRLSARALAGRTRPFHRGVGDAREGGVDGYAGGCRQ